MRKTWVWLAFAFVLALLCGSVSAMAAALPDGRRYELVSPPNKAGGGVGLSTPRTRAALDGSAIAFISLTPFGDAQGTGVETEYISERQAEVGTPGWATHAITARQEPLSIGGLLQNASPAFVSEFSPDLTMGVFRAWSPLTNAPEVAGVTNLYVRRDLRRPGAGTWSLVTSCPGCAGVPLSTIPGREDEYPWAAGTSSDFSRVAFESRFDLTGDGGGSLKVYLADDGVVRLVGAVPPEPSTACGGVGPDCVLPPNDGGSIAGLGARHQTLVPNVISDDGERVNFSAPVDGSTVDRNTSNVYQRDTHRTATTADDTTVLVNASERTNPEGSAGAVYQGASADGTRVFFTSEHALTDDSAAGVAHLYMWHHSPNDEVQRLTIRATGGTFTLTFEGQTTAPLQANAAAGQVAAALGALSSISGPGGTVEVSGGPGDDAGSRPYLVTFGGTLSGRDVPLMTADGSSLTGSAPIADVTPWVAGAGHLTLIDRDDEPGDDPGSAEGIIGSSQDGRYVYFVAGSQLVDGAGLLEAGKRNIYLWHDGLIRFIGAFTANAGAELHDWQRNMPVGAGTGLSLQEIFSRVTPDGRALLFGATNGSGLTGYDHTGCSAGGASGCMELYVYRADEGRLACATCPSGQPPTSDATLAVGRVLGVATSAHQSRALSDDGRRVFFTSGDALVAEDANGRTDAYEYDATSGVVSLLSSGKSSSDSFFMEASGSGADAFFATRESLVGWDVDTDYDLYDARVGGGFPDPVAVLQCDDNACQGPLNRPAVTAKGGSSTYAGSGNLRQHARRHAGRTRRCPRGRVRREVRGKRRCVRKRRHHRRVHHARVVGGAQ